MNNAALLKAIIENAIDGIIITDEKGTIELANPSLCELFGYTPIELTGNKVDMLMVGDDSILHQHYMKRYTLTRRSNIIGIGREVSGVKKDGTVFPFRLAVSEVLYNGKMIFAGIIHDLSREKFATESMKSYTSELALVVDERTQKLQAMVNQLKQAKEAANYSLVKEKEINHMKTRFVSMASHEFRSPLSAIQLSASLVERYYDRMDQKNLMVHIAKIKTAVTDLTTILDEFLSVERIETGKITPDFQEFDLVSFAEDIVAEMNLIAKKQQLIDYRHSGTGYVVTLDKNLLKHCITNLISNAIKYSDENGKIELNTEINSGHCLIKVKDHGIGIPEEAEKHIFEAFFRAGNAVNIGGTGLGLNIVQKYARLMNGAVGFERNKPSGTIFTLTFAVKGSNTP